MCDQEVEATVVTASVSTPENGGQIHMVIDITQETPMPIRTRAELLPSVSGEAWLYTGVSAFSPAHKYPYIVNGNDSMNIHVQGLLFDFN